MRKEHLGAYAILIQDESALLVRKSRGPYTGCWDLPGGRIEWGESPEETLRREIQEETGRTGDIFRIHALLSHTQTWVRPDGQTEELHHLGILYRTEPDRGKNTRLTVEAEGEDCDAVEWHPRESLTTLPLTPFARRVLVDEEGGSVWESNPPGTASPPRTRF